MPKVGMPQIRKPQLVNATMTVIDRVGLHAASIALMALLSLAVSGPSLAQEPQMEFQQWLDVVI